MKGDHKFKAKPKGSTIGGYTRARVQIGFDDKMRKAITKRAKTNGCSFAAEVRSLVAAGLEASKAKPDYSLTIAQEETNS